LVLKKWLKLVVVFCPEKWYNIVYQQLVTYCKLFLEMCGASVIIRVLDWISTKDYIFL
jgi:hypothetical protein